jgi:hypothetical protein
MVGLTPSKRTAGSGTGETDGMSCAKLKKTPLILNKLIVYIFVTFVYTIVTFGGCFCLNSVCLLVQM